MLFSIIIPVYNEGCSLDELVLRTVTTLNSINCNWEIIFVDDGSDDGSAGILCEYEKKINNFYFVSLYRNYGQTIALRAGIEASKGDVVVCMDGDLQHKPEDLPIFINYINEGYDFVSGYKDVQSKQRKSSKFAHFFIKLISGVDLKYFGATFKAFRRESINTRMMTGNMHRYLGVLLAKNANKIKEIPLSIQHRSRGKSKYKRSKFYSVLIEILSLFFITSEVSMLSGLFKMIGFTITFCTLTADIVLCLLDILNNFNIKEVFIVEFIMINFLLVIGILIFLFGILFELNLHSVNTPIYIIRKR